MSQVEGGFLRPPRSVRPLERSRNMDKDPFLADSSENADSSYSTSKFYTAARDKKGFSTTVRLNVPPTFMAELAALVASGEIPEYRTSADAIRDFLVHGLMVKKDAGASTDVLARIMLSAANLDTLEVYFQRRKELIDQYTKLLSAIQTKEDADMLRANIRRSIEAIHDDNYLVSELQLLLSRVR